MSIRSLVIALSLIAAMTLPRPTQAGDQLRIMVGGIEKQIYLPAKLAEQLGYFKDEGLDVELLTEPAGVSAEDELLAGAVQGVVGFYDHTIDLQSKGKFVESVVQLAHAPGEVILIASKEAKAIHSPADWRGKTFGVTGLGSSTNFLTQYIAVRNGVKSSEFTVLPVGAGNTFIAALQQGKIDGGMTTEPTVSRLVKSGVAKIEIDLRTDSGTRKVLGGTYPAAALYMQNSWVDGHRDETQKLANVFVRTLKYIATHSAAEIADKMPADYYAGDKPLYDKALADGKAMFTTDGKMPKDGPRTVLNVLAGFNSSLKGKSIDLSRTYTGAFVARVKMR